MDHQAYAMLALRLNRLLGGASLMYRGPAQWRAAAEAEETPSPGRLAEDAERLLEQETTPYQAAQLRAMRAVARRLAGERLSLADHAEQVLGLRPRRLPESVFEEAHARLNGALPRTRGALAERWRAWQAAYVLDDLNRLPGLVARAVAEAHARTSAIVPLPCDAEVGTRLVPEAHFHAAGVHEGGTRGTLYVNTGVPFNLADLLYVVTHEVFPGHIAEGMLKEIHIRRPEQAVGFLQSPSFALGEGLGLSAEQIAFPGDEAQVWLNRHVLPEFGIRPDGSDLAAIHWAKNVLWGVWGNVAFLADEGRPERELAAYLERWALYDEDEVARALPLFGPDSLGPYLFAYFHAWELLRDRTDDHDLVRRLLTEQLLPADLV